MKASHAKAAKDQEVDDYVPNIDLNKPFPNGCDKIPLPIKGEQLKVLKRVFGVATWSYNQAVRMVFRDKSLEPTMAQLRKHIVNKSASVLSDKPYVTDVAYDIRDDAVADLLLAYKANEVKHREGSLHKSAGECYYKFRSKKDKSRVITIRSRSYNRGSTFLNKLLTDNNLQATVPTQVDYDLKLQLTWLDEVYLLVPRPLLKKTRDGPTRDRQSLKVCSIDPGIRTFGTVYDFDGEYYEWGKADAGWIVRYCQHMDRLKSKIDQCKNKRTILSLTRAYRRMAQHLRNRVKDFHHGFANWLCNRYQLILSPCLSSHQLGARRQRKISSKTVRNMMTWSHARFRDILLYTAQKYNDCYVEVCQEDYTSKTCGGCGHLHDSLGAGKVYRCSSSSGCAYSHGRDLNGARNIGLKWLTTNASLVVDSIRA